MNYRKQKGEKVDLGIPANDKLVLIVGPSGSGKTTVAKELEKEGYNIIHSYTTRNPREDGEWGHIFIKNLAEDEEYISGFDHADKEVVRAFKGGKGELIAFKQLYNDIYFATREQYQGKGTSIYVVDPNGAEQVNRRVDDAEVITIFLMTDISTRHTRLRKRAGIITYSHLTEEENNQIQQMIGRLNKDKEIFSKCRCDYVVDANRELGQVLADIKHIIEA